MSDHFKTAIGFGQAGTKFYCHSFHVVIPKSYCVCLASLQNDRASGTRLGQCSSLHGVMQSQTQRSALHQQFTALHLCHLLKARSA